MERYVRFTTTGGRTGAGLLRGDRVEAIEEPFWAAAVPTGEVLALDSVRLLPPCLPRSIVCVGLNYASHLQGRPIPDPPTLFFKPLSSVAGPGDAIVLPRGAARVEPEGEIVAVVGRRLKGASREEALAGVFGYTCGNDVSARDWQQADHQWWRAKGSDTFAVFGPSVVTGLDHAAIDLRTRVNGVEVQHARSDELLRDIPEIVRLVSAVMTLVPGDLIYTGTPGSPPALSPGDLVEVEVTGAGVLANLVAHP
ncbi:MAG: fumarylacetoacetate hydrolase family protein [Dehalococcoidia bacterium]|nr:fumarylacetoacetate hydrolase family protein [Dehalococcoidia bacterium]